MVHHHHYRLCWTAARCKDVCLKPALHLQRWEQFQAGTKRNKSSNSAATRIFDQDDDRSLTIHTQKALVEFRHCRLHYPTSTSSSLSSHGHESSLTKPLNLTISCPTLGGHALLGRNSSGKSLVGQTIVARGQPSYLHEGKFSIPSNWMSNAIAHVSFDSHQQLLREGGTTYRAISGGNGTLNKAAQFLIVRFGLYALLPRDVDTLSTGEIRKTLLVRALSTRPKLLILDNAFDGLDVASREVLKDLVQKTIAGFTQDILVQGVSSKATAHTQILMMTHRPEELVDGLERVSWFDQKGNLNTENRRGRSGTELFQVAMDFKDGETLDLDWENDSVPSREEISSWWGQRELSDDFKKGGPVVQARNLTIQRGETTLLNDLNWTIESRQRWIVGGGNGAGKSTLSRLLARPDVDTHQLEIHGGVGWVSTERHMEMAKSEDKVLDVLTNHGKSPTESAQLVAKWLGIEDTTNRKFCHLSQGQQKLVLVGAALASRPQLLVLDEPCQGLDGIHRRHLLALVEQICRATDMSLVYITHHLEELLPSVSHALHLKDRRDVYQGPIETYHPEDL